MPLVFTLPATLDGDKLVPADVRKVKAEVLIKLDAWKTGIKVKSISANEACGKVFVRLCDQKDVDKAFDVIEKAMTDESSKLEIKQLQPCTDEVFFLPGIPSEVPEKEILTKLVAFNEFLKPALPFMRIKKKIKLKNNKDEYAVILSIDKKFAHIFSERKILVGHYRRWIQPALRKPFCGKCHRLGHFTKECSEGRMKSAAALGPDTCVNCYEYNEKLAESKKRNPQDKRQFRDENHVSSDRRNCHSYLSAAGFTYV